MSTNRYKMNEDQREALEELLMSHGWESLLHVVAVLAQEQEQNVIRYNLNDGPNGLVIEKARAEGANLLKRRLFELKDEIFNKKRK